MVGCSEKYFSPIGQRGKLAGNLNFQNTAAGLKCLSGTCVVLCCVGGYCDTRGLLQISEHFLRYIVAKVSSMLHLG